MARSRSEAPVTSPAHRVRELRDSAKTRQQIQTGKILASTHRRPQAKIVQDNFARWIARATDVLHIDLHSGLGKYGEYKLLIDDVPGSPAVEWYRRVFGEKSVEATVDVAGTAYKTSGDMGAWLANKFAHINYRFVTAEFGVYSIFRVLAALRAENRAYHFGRPGDRSYQRAKAELLECFCPHDTTWRETVVRRALQIVDQGSGAISFRK